MMGVIPMVRRAARRCCQFVRLTGLALAIGSMTSTVSHAAPIERDQSAEVGTTGFPVPRFASLGPSRVFMRSGPDRSYPVTWVYERPGLPVEVVQEYGAWRKVRDVLGTEGWINGNLISDQRTALITRSIRMLYAQPDINAQKLWQVEPGVVANIILCEEGWCQLSINGNTGWIIRDQIWGTYEGENFN